jgi:hypothetical protein
VAAGNVATTLDLAPNTGLDMRPTIPLALSSFPLPRISLYAQGEGMNYEVSLTCRERSKRVFVSLTAGAVLMLAASFDHAKATTWICYVGPCDKHSCRYENRGHEKCVCPAGATQAAEPSHVDCRQGFERGNLFCDNFRYECLRPKEAAAISPR